MTESISYEKLDVGNIFSYLKNTLDAVVVNLGEHYDWAFIKYVWLLEIKENKK